MLADAGVAVVTNPRTNLFLQARGVEAGPPRGLAGVRALLETGVLVAAGADNVQDPFYVIGRSDPLETASLLVSAAHLSVDESWRLVSPAVRAVMGLPIVEVVPGAPADLMAVRAETVREAIAEQPGDRLVFHAGRLVARTTTASWTA
jgi:cytosine deaminase